MMCEKKSDAAFPKVMADFTAWVVHSAKEKGISRLYFLARDGWIMYNTAKIIIERYGIDIEPRYLYCSRMSLRSAALSDIGEEAYRYLLEGGFSLTPRVILGRLSLNEEERKRVYADIGFSGSEDTEMGKAAAAQFCGKLRGSEVYNGFIKAVSRRSKETAAAYLEQEGLLSDTAYAIVDSGWTGSMQRMLRVLTGRRQTGFYFGMYSTPNAEDGDFYTYLFDKGSSPLLVSKFNNHLFEALCGAPHGMTTGYAAESGGVVPVLKSEKSINYGSGLIAAQEREIFRLAKEENLFPYSEVSVKERREKAFSLLDSLMYRPDKETAEKYGSLRFSDDPSELYTFPLAERLDDTKRLYFIPRLFGKLFKKGAPEQPVYWGYAAAALSGKGWFCRLNLRLWEVLWLIKRK